MADVIDMYRVYLASYSNVNGATVDKAFYEGATDLETLVAVALGAYDASLQTSPSMCTNFEDDFNEMIESTLPPEEDEATTEETVAAA